MTPEDWILRAPGDCWEPEPEIPVARVRPKYMVPMDQYGSFIHDFLITIVWPCLAWWVVLPSFWWMIFQILDPSL